MHAVFIVFLLSILAGPIFMAPGISPAEKDDYYNRTINHFVKVLEDSTNDIEKLVKFVTSNIDYGIRISANHHRALYEQVNKTKGCLALKNNFDLIGTHIGEIVQQCFQRTKQILEPLIDKMAILRKTVMNEISRWTTVVPNWPESTTTSAVGESTIIDKDQARILHTGYLKSTMERFEVTKKIKEIETNLSMSFCGIVMESYEKEARSLVNALRECVLPQGNVPGISTSEVS